MSASCQRGAFLVFEGCDRAGKTTQCKKLVESLKLRNIKTKFMAFPDRSTAVGGIIDSYLQKKCDLTDQAIHLLFSANRWELVPKMKEDINNGITLVVDRYSYSGVTFSAAKESMELEWCKHPEVGLPKPDAVFFLTMSSEALARRGGFGEERYETNEIQEKVRNNFLRLKDNTWQVIDADQDVNILHEDILLQALAIIERSTSTVLGQLW